MKMSSKPDLYFVPGGEISGFTSSGITSFQDIDPVAVVRELLQNSLDAARDAEREVTRIRFELKEGRVEDIPGIRTYRRSFEQALKTQRKILKGRFSDQAKNVIDAIQRCLDRKTCMTLYVLDNGIGLNEGRMKHLLEDGVSDKTESSTGAVGNGHLTVLPASELRYVLYGGRYQDNKHEEWGMICAGHAVLATHEKKKQRMSKDGYFLSGLQDGIDPYSFIKANGIPADIRNRLDWIRDNWEPGAGTIIMISAFNKFREEKGSLWDMVSQAAACNFFAAFVSGELEVEVIEKGTKNKISCSNIKDVLEQVKDRDRRGKFLSGMHAWSASKAIMQGEKHIVSTEHGNLSFRLLHGDRAGHMDTSRVDLCRNGMWISDELPKLKTRNLSEMQPFHCVILLEAKDGKIHRLVRKSEGPLHNELKARKLLQPKDWRSLEGAMEKVQQRLKELLPASKDKSFRIKGMLSVDVQGSSKGGRRRRVGKVNAFSKIPRLSVARRPSGYEEIPAGENPGTGLHTNAEHSDDAGQGGGGDGDRPQRRGPPVDFLAVPAQTGRRSCIVEIIPQKTYEHAEVCFSIDENYDETWETRSVNQFVNLEEVRIDGNYIVDSHTIHEGNHHSQSIPLGNLKEGQSVTLEFNFTLPKGTGLPDDAPVALKTQIFKTPDLSRSNKGDKT